MRLRKDEEIKARVDGRMKAELAYLAIILDLDVSDLIRQAVRDMLHKPTVQRQLKTVH